MAKLAKDEPGVQAATKKLERLGIDEVDRRIREGDARGVERGGAGRDPAGAGAAGVPREFRRCPPDDAETLAGRVPLRRRHAGGLDALLGGREEGRRGTPPSGRLVVKHDDRAARRVAARGVPPGSAPPRHTWATEPAQAVPGRSHHFAPGASVKVEKRE